MEAAPPESTAIRERGRESSVFRLAFWQIPAGIDGLTRLLSERTPFTGRFLKIRVNTA